ncbi:MAG: DUF1566 domain-containing protein [Betaproteobacteria bacterium]|nr:DUF1566 domain-containing protein [Betaproteobacteria bacterium]
MTKATSKIIIRTDPEFLRLGQPWPEQGGLFAGHLPAICRDGPGPDYFLIVPDDPKLFGADLAWGPYGKKIDGADHKQDGAANTQALLASEHSHPAAKFCAEFRHGGHADWHLPAQRELAVICAVLPDLPAAGWYWSSTQYSSDGAWYSYFPSGVQNVNGKDYKGRVLPVRKVLAI